MSKSTKPKKKISFNPLTGEFNLVTDNNFSYENIPNQKILSVRENNQMIIHEEFEIDGELRLDGSLIIEE